MSHPVRTHTRRRDAAPPHADAARLATSCRACGRSRILAGGRRYCIRCQRAELLAVLRRGGER